MPPKIDQLFVGQKIHATRHVAVSVDERTLTASSRKHYMHARSGVCVSWCTALLCMAVTVAGCMVTPVHVPSRNGLCRIHTART